VEVVGRGRMGGRVGRVYMGAVRLGIHGGMEMVCAGVSRPVLP
jgi:hypothetical protein